MPEKVKIDITWMSPEQKAMVKSYAAAKGLSFNGLGELALREKLYGKKKKKNVRSRRK